jgi:hypothetical protein
MGSPLDVLGVPAQPPVTLGVHHDRCENEEDVRVTFSVDNAQTAARAVLARVQAE